MDVFAALPGAVLAPDLMPLLTSPGGFKVEAAPEALAAWADTNSADEMAATDTWLFALDAFGCEGACWRGAARARQLAFLRALQK